MVVATDVFLPIPPDHSLQAMFILNRSGFCGFWDMTPLLRDPKAGMSSTGTTPPS